MHNVRVFTGNANRPLAEAICRRLGLPLGRAVVRRFSDGEVAVEVEESVRGWDVFVVQPTCPPVNDHLMELLVMMDALKRASANSISVVMPYYGYARQDRKVNPRVPITAKLVADLVTVAGADRILTVDLHAGQIQGFFDIPVDNLYATPVLLEEFRRRLPGDDLVVVSPDAGGVERARAFAKRLDAGLAIIDKRREKANVSEVMHIIGDVQDRDALLLDDMIDTAGTLTNAARALKKNGARRVFAAATHPVLSGPAVDRIVDSPLEQVVVTDTIPLSAKARESGKIHAVTVAGLLAEAIRRITECGSVSSLFV
ncbi:ribose-phosphate pyrophosphokinase [Deferrisoma camini]|uniref:ribose-phosphate pyrophosphokinase n=1 Tax=Deferrisoma camini TaxID=1035120 RepID=UPI00046D0D4B|nr:ribose-phosphate pyrophosphokinase [Deferrisoma camini]